MKKLSEKAREISKLYDTETGDIKDGLSILITIIFTNIYFPNILI